MEPTPLANLEERSTPVPTIVRPSVVALAAVALLAARAASAQEPGTLVGVVTNLNGIPVKGAEVRILKYALRAVTNDSGVYIFDAVPPGKLVVEARRIGFKPDEERVTVDPGKRKQLDFEMEGIPEQLDSVMIREAGGNGRLAEFWNRRMIGVGAFITRQDLDKRRPYRPSDMLRTITGVRVLSGENAMERPTIVMGRNSVTQQRSRVNSGPQLGGDCKITYYVDGMYVMPGTFHIDDLSPSAIEAVEIYRGPAEIPARYRQRETACGLIAIWTREPPPKPKDPVGEAR